MGHDAFDEHTRITCEGMGLVLRHVYGSTSIYIGISKDGGDEPDMLIKLDKHDRKAMRQWLRSVNYKGGHDE